VGQERKWGGKRERKGGRKVSYLCNIHILIIFPSLPSHTPSLPLQLKPLALVEDSRLYAAWGAYQVTKDVYDLKETLRLITPTEQ